MSLVVFFILSLGDRYRIKVYIQGTGTQQLIGKIDAELRNVKFVDKVHKISPDTCTVLNHYGGIAMRTIRQKLHCSIRLRTEVPRVFKVS